MASRTARLSAVAKAASDFTDRSYWAGTIKMSLSKLFILAALHEKPLHGYEIARSVERSTNGCCSPTEGTIYPAMREFEQGGYVTVEESVVQGRGRKTYALTDRGRTAFKVGMEAWADATRALNRAAAAAARRGWGCCES
jgi:PadR family transcriptional regulator, regulatory protein PadR